MNYLFWAGSEESYDVVVAAQVSLRTLAAATAATNGEMPDLPKAWTKEGSLAIVPIQGSLIDGKAGWLSLFGVTGYDDIAQAISEALADPDIKSILLDVASGGGAVTGCQDCATYISKAAAVKPMTAHATRAAASAGYWLAAAAPTVSLDPATLVGSIGVLQIQTSMNRMLEQNGVDKTIVRSGTHKALGGPFEPLSEEGKAEMQSQVNDLGAMFGKYISKARNVPYAEIDAMQGRVFLGQRAVTAGLADKVQSYDQAVASAKKLDQAKNIPNNPDKSKGANMKFNQAQLAALAAGATPEHVASLASVPDKTEAELAAEQAAATQAAQAAEAARAQAAAQAAAAAKPADTGIIATLQAQLKTAQDELVAAKVEAATAKIAVDGFKAAQELQAGLLTIARGAVSKMHVALGGSDATAQTLDAAAVITEHERVAKVFAEKFRPGGVAKVPTPEEKAQAAQAVQASKHLAAFEMAAKAGNSTK